MSSDRKSRAFSYSVFSALNDDASKRVHVPINGAPAEFDSPGFKGLFTIIHDTGNEPGGAVPCLGGETRRGVIVQIQGKFKEKPTMGEEQLTNIWIGGTLEGDLNLGWIMRGVVELCAKFAKKKTGNRIYFDLGSKDEARPSQLGFPLRTLFKFVITADGDVPPKLGSRMLDELKWQGPGLMEVDLSCTYTLVWHTPYVDLCSWSLLKIPAVSPMGLETVMGDICAARVFIYDLGKAGGNHANWKQGLIMESYFDRGTECGSWAFAASEGPDGNSNGAKTPIEDEASEASEASGEASLAGSEEDALVTERDEHSDSESSVDTLDDDPDTDEEEEQQRALNRSHSEALSQIEGWRPRQIKGTVAEHAAVQVPYYIEAIDRVRRRKVRIWFVFAMVNPEDGGSRWWHAKDAIELASLCRPKRRLATFRRGPGARRYTCCAVKTLEQFRTVVCEQLTADTQLRTLVLAAAASGSMTPPPEENLASSTDSPTHLSPARLARKVRRRALGPKASAIPPRFFEAADSVICGVAFAHARQGGQGAYREALVGALHFEGRICEELLRLSSDDVLRCFTPYDCEQPRISIHAEEIVQVEALSGLFLGRFHLWKVHTFVRVFVFCCAEATDRDDWVAALESMIAHAAEVQSPATATADASGLSWSGKPTSSTVVSGDRVQTTVSTSAISSLAHKPSRRVMIAKKAATQVATSAVSSLRAIAGGQPVPREAILLMDTSRARRWGRRRRFVLNDRNLVVAPAAPLPPSFAARLLERVLCLGEHPASIDVMSFMDSTCLLKAVRFSRWTENELLAFWLNVYHCLLLHGLLILGAPKSRTEMDHFQKRVSYLVGPRPWSLWEIETVILQIPKADQKAAREARVHARKLLGFCSFCRRRAGADQPLQNPIKDRVAAVSDDRSTKRAHLCLPNMPLPEPPWRYDSAQACLFLGSTPEKVITPKQDLRVSFVLNRGTLNCLSSVTVFNSSRLSSELDEVARDFVNTFVDIELQDALPTTVTLPLCCQGIMQALKDDQKALLQFLWNFTPKAWPIPLHRVKLKFKKFADDPRKRSEFTRIILIDSKPQKVSIFLNSSEFDMRSDTQEALRKLVEVQTLHTDRNDMPDVTIENVSCTRVTDLRPEVLKVKKMSL